jgi:hypothetical protein
MLPNQYITIVIALITAIIGPVIVEWVRSFFQSKKAKQSMDQHIALDEKIDNQIQILLEQLKCDRICIFQFHNGGHFYPTNKSIKKFSIFYESISEKAVSIKRFLQNIPVSLFPKLFISLYKNKEITIYRPESKNSDSETLNIAEFSDDKTNSFFILKIDDLNGVFIGFLTIAYYNSTHTLSDDELTIIRQKIGVLGTILTNYLYKKD